MSASEDSVALARLNNDRNGGANGGDALSRATTDGPAVDVRAESTTQTNVVTSPGAPATEVPFDRWKSADGVKKEPYEVLTWNEKKAILFALTAAMFLSALDQNIVIIALPKIVAELGGTDLFAWVISSYMLTSSATMALYGRFSDVYGRRVIFLIAVGLFLIGSILSGVANGIWFLIISRGVQGLGGGGLMSMSMIIVGDIVQPSDRAKYMSGMSSIFGIASVVAPLVGGVLTDQASWRWVFYINIPFCLLSFISAYIAMGRFELPSQNMALDVLGSALIACCTICIVLFVTWGGSETGYPWDSWIIIFLIVMSFVLFLAFVWQEDRHPLPILNLQLFKNFNFAVIMFLMFFAGMAMLGAFAYLPVYFQNCLHDDALMSGLKLIPMVFGFLLGAGMGGGYLQKTGRYKGWVPAGGALFTLGCGLLALLELDTNFGIVFIFEIICGCGIGIIFPITSVVVQNSVPVPDMANALSAFTFMQTMGAAIGVAILGAVLNNKLAWGLENGRSLERSFNMGLSLAFAVSVAPAGVCFLASLFLREVKLFTMGGEMGGAVPGGGDKEKETGTTVVVSPTGAAGGSSIPDVEKGVAPVVENITNALGNGSANGSADGGNANNSATV